MTPSETTFTPVRYSPGVAPPEPDFDRNLQQVIDIVEDFEKGSVEGEGEHRAVRFAHAKAYGLVRGTFEILDGVPPEYAQGIYARPGKHDVLVRYSNGLSHLGADRMLGNVVGMATKVFGVDSTTTLPDESASHTMDFNMINGPIFFCNTAAHYTFLAKLFIDLPQYRLTGRRGSHQMFHDWVTGYGTLPASQWAWDELGAMLRLGERARWQNLLLSSFFSMGAVRHGDYIAKLRIRPTNESAAGVQARDLDPKSGDEVFRPALVSELARAEHEFDFQVQLCASLETMPVDDLTVEWEEHESPFVTVARLRFARQDIGGESNLAAADALSFTPWRCPPEHVPIGSIQTVRKEVYRRSSLLRHELNGQPRTEPASAADVLPDPA
ncbi:catalase family protein [Streptomyces sp. VNUA116]|uniref:catalase family protein n=1 Tax=Streptomyces sp. VNUA116 TaxID=3062449 RepID=UPI002676751E|nr:catalase family protein [Streptomyces sp. VNUA116]WKU42854.1 catalase family protein [Streptomyces sp. VNUA116]